MNTKVFVYGSLMRGYWNNRLLATAKFLGRRRTRSHFTMLSLGAFPALVRGRRAIEGELYEVDSATLADLDRLEGAPRFYRREAVELADGTAAELYVLADTIRAEGREVVESGDWRKERPYP